VHGITDQVKLNDILFSIYYSDHEGYDGRRLFIEMSFTFYHWKIVEALQKDLIGIQNLKEDEIKLMCLNIFPQANTVIHKLFYEEEYIKRFYETSRKQSPNQKVGKIQIPFIRNFKGLSPMHYCLQNNNYQAMNCLLELIS
jgi:hypothetical protein